MKHLSWILTVPLIVVAVVFSIANREPANVDLWPFPLSYSPPLFVLLLASLFIGALIGGLVTWLSAAPVRRRARHARRKAAELERELARVKQERRTVSAPPAPSAAASTLPAATSDAAERDPRSAVGS